MPANPGFGLDDLYGRSPQRVYPTPPFTPSQDFEDRIFANPNAPGTETLGFDRMDLNEQGKWRPLDGAAPPAQQIGYSQSPAHNQAQSFLEYLQSNHPQAHAALSAIWDAHQRQMAAQPQSQAPALDPGRFRQGF